MIINKYIANGNEKVDIIKAPNGKYYNDFYSTSTLAGPYDSLDEAKKYLKKHRSDIKKDSVYLANRSDKNTRKDLLLAKNKKKYTNKQKKNFYFLRMHDESLSNAQRKYAQKRFNELR